MEQKLHVTCAVAIFTPPGILLVHPNGARYAGGWSLPKGLRDPHETEAQAACREVREETGLIIKPDILADHGRFPYTREKDYHLFSCVLGKIPMEQLVCESTFEYDGQQIKEVDNFMVAPLDSVIDMLNKKQSEIFASVAKIAPSNSWWAKINVRPIAGRKA